MLRRYVNTAPPSMLQSEIGAGDTLLDIGDASAYPTKFPFVVAIERGTINEEACLVTDRDATTLTVERGFDGTQAVFHPGLDSSGEEAALVEHTTAAIDYREAGIPGVTEAERDALDDFNPTEMWDGRAIYNYDRRSVEVSHYEQDELGSDESLGDNFIGWFGLLPTGTVLPFSSTVIPPGFLRCDGGEHLRVDYPGLSSIYEADAFPFGNGDGSTTFNVPDLRQSFPLGVADAGTGSALGESGGEIEHIHTQPSHVHAQPNHTHSNPNVNSNGGHNHSQGSTDSAGNHNHSQGSTGSAGSHSHSQGSTGNASVGSSQSEGTSGLLSDNDIEHSHSFSDSEGSLGGTAFQNDGHSHGIGTDGHSHSGTTSFFSGAGGAHDHDHNLTNVNNNGGHTHGLSSVNSNGGHTHNLDPTNSDGSHVHSQGDTGTANTTIINSSGDDPTGGSNPPYVALHFIVKV